MVVGGDGPEVGGGHPVRLAFLLEEADDAGGVLEDLDDAVEEDAVEAGVVEADGRLVVLDEGVHGGPPMGVGITLDDTEVRLHMGISRGTAPCLVLLMPRETVGPDPLLAIRRAATGVGEVGIEFATSVTVKPTPDIRAIESILNILLFL